MRSTDIWKGRLSMHGPAPDPTVLSANTLIGDEVCNLKGEKLGEIKDLSFDLEKGCIAYVILSAGGFLGLGNKLFAVPWQALTMSLDEDLLNLDISQDALQHAPSFPKDNWPDMADRQWGAEIHSYYGCQPYWER